MLPGNVKIHANRFINSQNLFFPQNDTIQISVAAYKHADGKKIDGKRVLVDVERARTVKGWLPRRLGGGLGGTRRGGPEVNIKHSGREDNVREKERYRLEREREDRRGVDDRRGGDRFEGRKRSRSREKSRSRRSHSKERRRRGKSREEDVDRYERRGKSRDKERKRRRSRSRDRDRSDRKKDKRDRSRSRDKDRERKRDKERKERKPEFDNIKIKEEPVDDYPDFSQQDYSQYAGQVKYESDDEQKYRPADQGNGSGSYDYR